MDKFFTPGFFKFLLGFSLLILGSFIAIALFGASAPSKTPDAIAAPSS